MGSTYYQNVNGRMRSENRNGVRRDYATDALGSVTATIDSTGAVENTYRYKPYGATLAKTGSGTDPRYMWTGDTGSRTTNRRNAEQYNRRRHYGSLQAAWTSVDPLWPEESAFGYVVARPTTAIDPSGLEAACATLVLVFIPGVGEVVLAVAALGALALLGYTIIRYVESCPRTTCESGPSSGGSTGQNRERNPFPESNPIPIGGPHWTFPNESNCDDDTLKRMNNEVKKQCKSGYWMKCDGLKMPKDEGQIRAILARNERCLRARMAREILCFSGGNQGHRDQIDQVRNRWNNCWKLLYG